MIMDTFNDIINAYDENTTKYKLSQFFQENIHEVPYITLEEIAQRKHISRSQISKYVRQIEYANYEDFKDACYNYIESLERRQSQIRLDSLTVEAAKQLNDELHHQIQDSLAQVDLRQIKQLIHAINRAQTIYIYAQGDTRYLGFQLQSKFQVLNKVVFLSDPDFRTNIQLRENNILLVLSIDGNTFRYNHGIVRRIKNTEGQKWLLTSRDGIDFPGQQCILPVKDPAYSNALYKWYVDLILQQLSKT